MKNRIIGSNKSSSPVNKKQLIAGFKNAQKGFIKSINRGMDYAFEMGEILLKVKEITPHGQFENVLKNEMDFAFGMRYAQMLMKISANKLLLVEYHKKELLTINEMMKIISEATPDQIAHVDKLKFQELAKLEAIAQDTDAGGHQGNDDDEVIDRLVIDSSPVLGQEGEEEIIDGEFTEIHPDPAPPDPPPIADSEQSTNHDEYTAEDRAKDLIADLTEENRELAEDNNRMRLILEDTNETAAALREIDKLKSLNNGLQDRINSLTNENAALIRTVNSWERRYKKLQKELKEAGHE